MKVWALFTCQPFSSQHFSFLSLVAKKKCFLFLNNCFGHRSQVGLPTLVMIISLRFKSAPFSDFLEFWKRVHPVQIKRNQGSHLRRIHFYPEKKRMDPSSGGFVIFPSDQEIFEASLIWSKSNQCTAYSMVLWARTKPIMNDIILLTLDILSKSESLILAFLSKYGFI